MKVDTYEPIEIEALLKQSLPDTFRTELNANGFADYLWYTADNLPEQAERKQVTEILSDMAGVEYQLGNEIADVPDLFNMILIVEGIVEATPTGVQTFLLAKNGNYFRKSRSYNFSYARYEGWKIAQSRAGVLVWLTSSWLTTVQALVQFQKSAENNNHTALNRHLKQRPKFKRNPFVETLMGIKDANIGPELGQVITQVWGNPWDFIRQSPEAIAEYTPGIGIPKARTILEAFGRKL